MKTKGADWRIKALQPSWQTRAARDAFVVDALMGLGQARKRVEKAHGLVEYSKNPRHLCEPLWRWCPGPGVAVEITGDSKNDIDWMNADAVCTSKLPREYIAEAQYVLASLCVTGRI